MGGYYATDRDFFHEKATETADGFVYETDKIFDAFAGTVGNLYDPQRLYQLDAKYDYGPIAVMYLGELSLRHKGSSAVTRDENGQVTRIDSGALRAGVSKLIEAAHNGVSLDQLIFEYSDGFFADTDDFSRRYIVGDENGRDTESLQFTADLLNYLEKLSGEQGKPVSGSMLVDFDDSLSNYVNADGEAESDCYTFTDSSDYVPSDVSAETAAAQGEKSEFDLEAYRAEMEREWANESGTAGGEGSLPDEPAAEETEENSADAAEESHTEEPVTEEAAEDQDPGDAAEADDVEELPAEEPAAEEADENPAEGAAEADDVEELPAEEPAAEDADENPAEDASEAAPSVVSAPALEDGPDLTDTGEEADRDRDGADEAPFAGQDAIAARLFLTRIA